MAKELDELPTRVRQRAITELGTRALSGTYLQGLMDETMSFVADTLEVEHCKTLELLQSGDRLLLMAGVGWGEGYVGRATVGASSGSEAGYTLQSGAPVIVEKFRDLQLPAVRRAVESHGGQVGVKSILGRGSIFTLSLSLSAQDLTNERENPRKEENPHRR